MERKSESICSWAVAKIKSLLGLSVPVKKFLDTLPELQTTNIIDFLDDESTMKLAFASKTMNSKIKAYRTRKFEEENLLDCILAILVLERDVPSCRYFVENCVDYKTDGKFNVFDYEVRVRTLRDFAEHFVKPKNNSEYNQLIKKLADNYKPYNNGYNKKIWEANIAYVENLILIGCGKPSDGLWKERINDTKKYSKHKYKKQIKNYEKITGNSYRRIYNSIKNKPENRIPQVETYHYIQAYEKLNNQN